MEFFADKSYVSRLLTNADRPAYAVDVNGLLAPQGKMAERTTLLAYYKKIGRSTLDDAVMKFPRSMLIRAGLVKPSREELEILDLYYKKSGVSKKRAVYGDALDPTLQLMGDAALFLRGEPAELLERDINVGFVMSAMYEESKPFIEEIRSIPRTRAMFVSGGTPGQIVRRMAEAWRYDDYIAPALEIKNGRFTGRFEGSYQDAINLRLSRALWEDEQLRGKVEEVHPDMLVLWGHDEEDVEKRAFLDKLNEPNNYVLFGVRPYAKGVPRKILKKEEEAFDRIAGGFDVVFDDLPEATSFLHEIRMEIHKKDAAVKH
ncbi:MAG: hypothetical protein HYS81_02560 [Candidatus Aenigmatarchaeota archaeon]|nr:MAG: hypothetical protein HYS81_02560 [Candidatus Aenigmarchaeota archaeon]